MHTRTNLSALYPFIAATVIVALASLCLIQRTEINQYRQQVAVLHQQLALQQPTPAATPNPQDLKDLANGFSKLIGGQ